MTLSQQAAWLLLLALPVACVSWTVTHEEIFREPREYCAHKSKFAKRMLLRKCFYMLTCEYCFSHWVTLFFLFFTDYRLLLPGFRGFVLAWFAVVWVANFYMGLFGRLRLDIKSERIDIEKEERELGVSRGTVIPP